MGCTARTATTSSRRILPIAAVPAAVAGLAATFALGNVPAASAAPVDASGHTAAAPAAPASAAPGAGLSAAQLMSISYHADGGQPVVKLDATRLTAIATKGRHHRPLAVNYVVKSGDTLASIARHLYHSASYWPVLYWANQHKIADPDQIQAGQLLKVPARPATIPAAPKAAAPVAAPAASTVTETVQAAAPAPTTYTGSTSAFQACVIAAESGGNPDAWNPSGHWGLYQFSASTWAAYGGNPADFGTAGVAEQNQVFDNAIADGGEDNWAPYDGC